MAAPALALIGLLAVVADGLADGSLPMPTAKEKCPVCGMFVARYPDWLCVVTFRDGAPLFTDGPKDLFTLLLDTGKFRGGGESGGVLAVGVKDYYSLKQIDGRKAFYVIGSDVYGPMGKELIPFEREDDAGAFLRDHKGTKVLRFGDVTPALLKSLG
jgi:nitrous oxide reductase accessory protein NosL